MARFWLLCSPLSWQLPSHRSGHSVPTRCDCGAPNRKVKKKIKICSGVDMNNPKLIGQDFSWVLGIHPAGYRESLVKSKMKLVGHGIIYCRVSYLRKLPLAGDGAVVRCGSQLHLTRPVAGSAPNSKPTACPIFRSGRGNAVRGLRMQQNESSGRGALFRHRCIDRGG
jgi:hypothetical protein